MGGQGDGVRQLLLLAQGPLLQLQEPVAEQAVVDRVLYLVQLKLLPLQRNQSRTTAWTSCGDSSSSRVEIGDLLVTIQLKQEAAARSGRFDMGLGAEISAVGSIHQLQTRSLLRLSGSHTAPLERQAVVLQER